MLIVAIVPFSSESVKGGKRVMGLFLGVIISIWGFCRNVCQEKYLRGGRGKTPGEARGFSPDRPPDKLFRHTFLRQRPAGVFAPFFIFSPF
jgi:hypothetical protein